MDALYVVVMAMVKVSFGGLESEVCDGTKLKLESVMKRNERHGRRLLCTKSFQ